MTTTAITLLATPLRNTSLSTNQTLVNNNQEESNEVHSNANKHQLKIILFSIIFTLSITGNILLLFSIVYIKRLRRVKVNYLIFHLGFCDIMRTIFEIPFQLVNLRGDGTYQFDESACKTIWPLATYATNCSALTLVCIAIERYLAINSIGMQHEKLLIFVLIFLVHVISIASVVPYIITLTYIEWDGSAYCYEEWKRDERRLYTLILFTLQYALPCLLIVLFYGLAWWRIMRRNKRMIQVSEEYERKVAYKGKESGTAMESEEQDSSISVGSEAEEKSPPPYEVAVLMNGESYSNNNNKLQRGGERLSRKKSILGSKLRRIQSMRIIKKPRFISQTAYVRHRQIIRTLAMFTTVVVVFVIFGLPNQIVWLMIEFSKSGRQVNVTVLNVCLYLTYTNAIINCWIYGGLNKQFRKAYKEVFVAFVPCFQRCCGSVYNRNSYHSTMSSTRVLSTYRSSAPLDETCESEEFLERQRAFTDMFQDHLDNFEKYKHLYEKNDAGEIAENPAEIESLITTAVSSAANSRKSSLARPPALALARQQPMFEKKYRRASASAAEYTNTKWSCVDLDFIDTENLIPRETLKERKRKTKSTSELSDAQQQGHKRSLWDILSPLNAKKKYRITDPFEAVDNRAEPGDVMVQAIDMRIETTSVVRNVNVNQITNFPQTTLGNMNTTQRTRKGDDVNKNEHEGGEQPRRRESGRNAKRIPYKRSVSSDAIIMQRPVQNRLVQPVRARERAPVNSMVRQSVRHELGNKVEATPSCKEADNNDRDKETATNVNIDNINLSKPTEPFIDENNQAHESNA